MKTLPNPDQVAINRALDFVGEAVSPNVYRRMREVIIVHRLNLLGLRQLVQGGGIREIDGLGPSTEEALKEAFYRLDNPTPPVPKPVPDMEYRVCWDWSTEALEAEVNRLIPEGWEPQGGVAICRVDGGPFCAQAMIRRDEPEKAHDPSR